MSIEEKILNLASHEDNFVFLYDAKKTSYSNGNSIFAWDLQSEISENNLKDFSKKIDKNKKYFGYFAYDLKNEIEQLETEKDFYIKDYPLIHFANFENEISCNNLDFSQYIKQFQTPIIDELFQQYSHEEYISKISQIKNYIENGEVYQANLTLKFCGKIKNNINHFLLFLKLISLNPVPFAAFYKFKNFTIISASPELFFSLNNERKITTCPIKGTAKPDNLSELSNFKETAENLMITDLMRNDLSKICEKNTVLVENLFNTEEFVNYGHLYSKISGVLKDEIKFEDVISNIFPPASMTGAPKIAAMNICSKLEKHKRGIYSGILGYFKGDNLAEFSVIIRTLICQGNNFEFQVGGGITYDSVAEKEYREILTKAKPIIEALEIQITSY
jgi:anthranilate/para-aminobenzoate synthase component I